MLNRENDKLQAALGFLEACAGLYANDQNDPVMKAQIQAQTDRVRKALVAAQSEAREVEERHQRLASRYEEFRRQLYEWRTEALELREKLERMVEIREAAVDVMGNALRLNGGGFHVYQRPLERLIAALSLPAAEQLDDWPESRVDVIGQNGNDGHHYAEEPRRPHSERANLPGAPLHPAHAKLGNLPLMARREWMQNHVFVAIGPNGEQWGVTEPGVLSGAARVYRIADTDEHGLSVIERTADMPEGAKYRYWYQDLNQMSCCYNDEYIADGRRWERIEDYQHGQEGRDDG